MRFLRLLSTFNFDSTPIIINFENTLTGDFFILRLLIDSNLTSTLCLALARGFSAKLSLRTELHSDAVSRQNE